MTHLIERTMIVLSAHRLFTPQEEIKDPLLFIEDGLISAVSSRAQQEIPKNAKVIDLASDGFADAVVAPGFEIGRASCRERVCYAV